MTTATTRECLTVIVTGNYDGNVITVRQLLQHTSGLVRFPSDAGPRTTPTRWPTWSAR